MMWNEIKRPVMAMIKRWGVADSKRRVWDTEFASGQWNYLENSAGDLVYACLEKYANCGDILDLGCGSGNTGNEIDPANYESYTGTDVSAVAIRKAKSRTRENQREAKNEYLCCDIESFIPSSAYDVILFRESIYYIPMSKIKGVLDRYAAYLKPGGVFIVRLCDREKHKNIVELIDRHYSEVEKHMGENDLVVIFR
jgi:SAM-dependent methyltransferase